MTRPKHPITLRHDDGREYVIAHTSRITGTAVAAAAKKQWHQVEEIAGGPLLLDRHPIRHSTQEIAKHWVHFRAAPWSLEAHTNE